MLRGWLAAMALVGVGVLALGPGVSAEPSAEPTPSKRTGYSGIARIHDDAEGTAYLVVHDRKDWSRHADRAWMGVLTWTPAGGQTWVRLDLPLPGGERPLNDLEACCRIPGEGHRFLLAESGYRVDDGEAKYGRVVLVELSEAPDTKAGWRATWTASFRPFAPSTAHTPKNTQVEGMQCIAVPGGAFVLVLSTLGDPAAHADVIWGALDLTEGAAFEERGRAKLTPGSGPLEARASSALFLRPGGDGLAAANKAQHYYVWSVATADPGEGGSADAGPFRSEVYVAGRLDLTGDATLLRYTMRPEPMPLWRVEGFKIEGVSRPPSGVQHAGLAVVTDDEDHLGVWRVLPSRRP